ncbi:MAG: damage-inducible protein DinB [Candidimonas sp.]|nr:MAG: damage-inducible protein DinB [Candidimonas sp.]
MQLQTLTRYSAWANTLFFSALEALPAGEATKERPTVFKNMVHTFNHIYVIDSIFKAHLEGRPHHYTARNTPTPPPLAELRQLMETMDQWYIGYASALSARQHDERVRFQFVGGGDGVMSRDEIITHIVNHATYHRGTVADLMHQVPAKPPVVDLTVFLRDVPQ